MRRPGQIRGVGPTTQRSYERPAIHGSWWSDMTRFAMQVRRQDIDCAYDVPVEHATASRALVDASAGLFPLPTHGACLGRVVLILQHDFDPDMLGLVRDVLAQPPMRPARHFLIGSMTQGHAVGYVPHVADDDLACTPGHRMIDHGAADLVQDVRSRRSCWALKRFIRFWMRLRLFDPRFFRSRKEANSDRRLFPYCLQALSARQESTRACSVSAMTDGWISPMSTASTRSPGAAGGTRPSSRTMCQVYL